jgi:voltage-dependent potassium channel beta subunit
MEYRFLGRSGLQVSALSLGSWITFGIQVDEDVAYDCMRAAFDAGVNFFDNAEVYAGGKAEILMGKVLKRARWRRNDLVISTKIFWGGKGVNRNGLSRKHILEGLRDSLDRMQLEYVDLIFCHRPDIHTPIEETVRAMSFLVDQGLAFYWGTSQWSAQQITEAYYLARREHLVPPLMEQPEYNMFYRERVEVEYLPLYQEIGLGTTIFSPLASGILTGKHGKGFAEESRVQLKGYEWLKEEFESVEGQQNIQKTEALRPIAAELDCSLAQLALAWCLKNPHVSSVITGASRPEQVVENMQALEVVPRLTEVVMERIEAILDNKPEPPEDYR